MNRTLLASYREEGRLDPGETIPVKLREVLTTKFLYGESPMGTCGDSFWEVTTLYNLMNTNVKFPKVKGSPFPWIGESNSRKMKFEWQLFET